MFIRHLSIADLMFTVTAVLPWAVTASMRKWVFGQVVCFVFGVVPFVAQLASMVFIIAVAAHRLGRCMAPMSIAWLNQKRAMALIVILWVSAFAPFILILVSKTPVRFDPTVTYCLSTNFTDLTEGGFKQKMIYLLVWAGFLTLLSLNIAILSVARRTTRISITSIKTVCWISGVFLVSWCIALVRVVLSYVHPQAQLLPFLLRLMRYLYIVAAVSNPFIYSLTNVKFKMFIFKLFKKVLFRQARRFLECREAQSKIS